MSGEAMDIRIAGTMTTLSPINIQRPQERTISVGKENVPRTAHEVVYHGGRRVEVPCITESTIRGGLRRAVSDEARDGMSGPKPLLSDYLYNAVGGVKGGGKEDIGDIMKRRTRRDRNPVVALFGAATPWTRGMLQVGSAWADPEANACGEGRIVQAELVSGRRTDDIAQNPDILDLLDPGAFDEWNRMREAASDEKAVKARLKDLKRQAVSATPEEKSKLNAEIREIEDSLKGDNAILRPLHHFVLPRGVLLRHEMALWGVKPHEAGLFIAGVHRFWMRKPFFGGRINHGYGLTSACWEVSCREDAEWKPLGVLCVEPHVGITERPEEIGAWLEAWQAYRESGNMCLSASAA